MSEITKPELKEGEIYIGAIINADGTGNHIILLDGDVNDVTWKQAMEWAKEQGGDLPNRVEQALLFDKHKDKFEERAYWSNAQHASRSDFCLVSAFPQWLPARLRQGSRAPRPRCPQISYLVIY